MFNHHEYLTQPFIVKDRLLSKVEEGLDWFKLFSWHGGRKMLNSCKAYHCSNTFYMSEISPILRMSAINFFISSELTSFHEFHNDLHLIGWLWLINLVAYSFVFFTRSSTNLLVKSNLKKKIEVVFSVTSIFHPFCSLNGKPFIVGGSSFQISERGSSISESELGSAGELISQFSRFLTIVH